MATNVKSSVAPLGTDAAAAQSMEQLKALRDSFSGSMGFVPPPMPDPRADVQDSIGSIPMIEPMSVPRGTDLMRSDMLPSSPEEAAAMAGSQYAPAATAQPVYKGDEMVIGPDGQPVMQPITTEAYGEQLTAQRGAFNDVSKDLQAIAADPYKSQEAITRLLEDKRERSYLSNAREQGRLDAHFEGFQKWIDSVGTHIGNASNAGIDALFTNRSKAMVMEDDKGEAMPAGLLVMQKMGTTDPAVAQMIGTMGGIALNQSVSQMGVWQQDKKKDPIAGKYPPEGTEFMHDAINSTSHFLANGFRNSGIDMERGDVDFLAKALVYDAVERGDLHIGVDPNSGRWITEASQEMKQQAMELQRIGDAMTGTSTRNASSVTPNPSGTSFTAGAPQLSARSLKGEGMVDKAATITKNILGSVAYIFRKKDYDRKVKELEMVFAPEFVMTDAGMLDSLDSKVAAHAKFQYSTHPLAKRNGVHKSAFETAKLDVARPQNFNGKNPNHEAVYKDMQVREATKVMSEEKLKIEYTMKSIQDKSGLRYAEFIHALSNQRFFVNSYDLDYMGSKNVIRDVLGMAYQDTTRVDHLLDPGQVLDLKKKAQWVFNGNGMHIHESLTKLNPSELGAIGTMYNAVIMFHTAFDHSVPGVSKLPIREAIKLYNPGIARKLAGIGEKYNAFLQNPTIEPDPEMMGFWAASEKGEALGSLNLIDDMFKAVTLYDNPETKSKSIGMTHHAFYDGNQNGIFLQGLFFGQKNRTEASKAIVRLSQANPKLSDMRVYVMQAVKDNLSEVLNDKPAQLDAWKRFWKEAVENHTDGVDGVAKDFFKIPLMQNSYGKDASMFTDVLYNMLSADDNYVGIASKHLHIEGVYDRIEDAARSLSDAVEMSLRQVVSSDGVNMMKSIGRNFALVNSPMILSGVTGDTYMVSQVGTAPLNKTVKGKNYVKKEVDGRTVYLKKPEYVGHDLVNPETGEVKEVASQGMQALPNYSVGKKRYFNRSTRMWDEFNNPLGMSLARQAVVLLIQALDGDLVKWSTIEANKGLKTPRPVTWVHDSIISTPGQSLIYANMYNNVAIPNAVNEVAKLGKKIEEALETARAATLKSVKERQEPVGIGEDGEYASIGALFDEFNTKVDPNYPQYKEIRIRRAEARAAKRRAQQEKTKNRQSMFDRDVDRMENRSNPTPEQEWNAWADKVSKQLDEAEKLGWVPQGKMSEKDRRYIAVSHENFPALLELAEEMIGTSGPSSKLKSWFSQFADRVKYGQQTLHSSNRPGEILQMSASGNKRPIENIGKVLPKARPKDAHPEELLVPKKPMTKGGYDIGDQAFDGSFDTEIPF